MSSRLRWLRKKRVIFPLALFAIIVVMIGRPVWLVTNAYLHDRDERRPPAPGTADDASRINQTPIAKRIEIPAEETSATALLRSAFQDAREHHLPIAIAGKRHSMGGQTIAPNGIQLDMLPHNAMHYDPTTELLHVQSGATWAQVLLYLDPLKRSVAIMQSDNDFSIGGSLSVNCHGWQFDRPPIASSVDSFRLMLADGSINNCSRIENSELFSLVLGGYGLFGIILDADLRTVPNERYEVTLYAQPATDFLAAARTHLSPKPDIGMTLGRLSIAPENFLRSSVLYAMRRIPSTDLPPLQPTVISTAIRSVFLASAYSDAGKSFRWQAENYLLQPFVGKSLTRNQLLNDSCETYANHTDATTHILQEYFIPPDHLDTFLTALQTIIPSHHANLLNVTLRDIREDHDTFLRYANTDVIAVVLLFQIPRIPTVDPQFIALTRECINAALTCTGTYYLPYRLDATSDQFRHAYPQAHKFFALKRKYDPNDLFQNAFYRQYSVTTPLTTSPSH